MPAAALGDSQTAVRLLRTLDTIDPAIIRPKETATESIAWTASHVL